MKVIAETVAVAVQSKRAAIKFIRAGEKTSTQHIKFSRLSNANDWEIRADLEKRLKFPEEIIETALRPDIIVFSTSTKQIIMLELTIEWEENFLVANERKLLKYEPLVDQSQRKGWRASCYPIEVGCRGFVGNSLSRVMTNLGITGSARRKAIKRVIEAAEKASKWLWILRKNSWKTYKN